MDIDDSKRLVREFYAAGNRGDLATCFDMLAKDVSWTVQGTTRFSGTFSGIEALQQQLIGPLFGALKAGISTTIDALIAEGDTVVALTHGEAETVEGVPYRNCYCHVFRIRDGRITAVTEYLDTALTDRVFGSN